MIKQCEQIKQLLKHNKTHKVDQLKSPVLNINTMQHKNPKNSNINNNSNTLPRVNTTSTCSKRTNRDNSQYDCGHINWQVSYLKHRNKQLTDKNKKLRNDIAELSELIETNKNLKEKNSQLLNKLQDLETQFNADCSFAGHNI